VAVARSWDMGSEWTNPAIGASRVSSDSLAASVPIGAPSSVAAIVGQSSDSIQVQFPPPTWLGGQPPAGTDVAVLAVGNSSEATQVLEEVVQSASNMQENSFARELLQAACSVRESSIPAFGMHTAMNATALCAECSKKPLGWIEAPNSDNLWPSCSSDIVNALSDASRVPESPPGGVGHWIRLRLPVVPSESSFGGPIATLSGLRPSQAYAVASSWLPGSMFGVPIGENGISLSSNAILSMHRSSSPTEAVTGALIQRLQPRIELASDGTASVATGNDFHHFVSESILDVAEILSMQSSIHSYASVETDMWPALLSAPVRTGALASPGAPRALVSFPIRSDAALLYWLPPESSGG